MNLRTIVLLFALAFAPAVQALNPQPEPPGKTYILTNGIHATVVNDHLMLAQKGGNRPAAAGQYVTRDGLKLVVTEADGQLDAATLKRLRDHPAAAK
jgi:hypothetical protein